MQYYTKINQPKIIEKQQLTENSTKMTPTNKNKKEIQTVIRSKNINFTPEKRQTQYHH